MSTTITIPTELERKIAGRAASQGKEVEEFALETLSRAVEMPSLRELFADVRQEICTTGVSQAELDAQIESAVNREKAAPCLRTSLFSIASSFSKASSKNPDPP